VRLTARPWLLIGTGAVVATAALVLVVANLGGGITTAGAPAGATSVPGGTPTDPGLSGSALSGSAANATPTPSQRPGTASPGPLGRTTPTAPVRDLTDPRKKDIAMQLVSSAENSSLNWRAQYSYIEDIGDGRGYTGGIIGFCSGTGDMLEVVQDYADHVPGNPLAAYLPALRKDNGTDSHAGLDPNFTRDWRAAAADAQFQAAQDRERDRVYFNPAVAQAKTDGLGALGQFIYYDAMVMHGPGNDASSFGGIRKKALTTAKSPAQGGNETTYLNAFLDARKAAMLTEEAHSDTSRVDTEQRVFLAAGDLGLDPPLRWHVYGDPYAITS
jgi:chitosanase